MAINITLPDGSVREYPDGVTGTDVAESIGSRLAKAAVAIKIDGESRDLLRPIESDGAIEIVTENTEAGRHIMRHSCLLYTSPSPRDGLLSRMPSSA